MSADDICGVGRREFITDGLTASTAMWLGVGAFRAVDTPANTPLTLDRFVFDSRFAEAAQVAGQVASRGVSLSAISGDVTPLWYEHLVPLWKESPQPIAGITTAAGVFVLEMLAADFWMRVVYRGEHSAPRNGGLTHFLMGPESVVIRATELTGTDSWKSPLAVAMTQCPRGERICSNLRMTTSVGEGSARLVPLFSWIIAPRA